MFGFLNLFVYYSYVVVRENENEMLSISQRDGTWVKCFWGGEAALSYISGQVVIYTSWKGASEFLIKMSAPRNTNY